jgi:hypothetical protein
MTGPPDSSHWVPHDYCDIAFPAGHAGLQLRGIPDRPAARPSEKQQFQGGDNADQHNEDP